MTTEISSEEKLRKLGEQVRKGLVRKHPITQQELAKVRAAARAKWEKEQEKRKAMAKKREELRQEKAREEEKKEQARKRNQRSQSDDQGHSH